MYGDLESDHDVLVTLHRFTLATAEQLHQLHGGAAGIKQTQKRMARLQAEGLAEFVTLPQAGRAKAWHLTAAGSAVTATFPEALHPSAPVPGAEKSAVRHGREHLLDVGRIHAAFVTDAWERGEACGPLDLLPAPEHPAGPNEPDGNVYRPPPSSPTPRPPTASGSGCGRSSNSTAPARAPSTAQRSWRPAPGCGSRRARAGVGTALALVPAAAGGPGRHGRRRGTRHGGGPAAGRRGESGRRRDAGLRPGRGCPDRRPGAARTVRAGLALARHPGRACVQAGRAVGGERHDYTTTHLPPSIA